MSNLLAPRAVTEDEAEQALAAVIAHNQRWIGHAPPVLVPEIGWVDDGYAISWTAGPPRWATTLQPDDLPGWPDGVLGEPDGVRLALYRKD